MNTLVDTCVLSEVQHPKGAAQVRQRFSSLSPDEIFLSALTLGEIQKGIDKLADSDRKRVLSGWLKQLIDSAEGKILAVDVETALIWGAITARSEKRGRPLPAIDGIIAASALQHGLQLMTRNVSDFSETGVIVVNPWE